MNRPGTSDQGEICSGQARKYDAAGTRAALMDAAISRFGKYGYDGTSVRDIAKEAGVDAALVYRYFGSKEALFKAVTTNTALFEPLRCLPLEDVPAWICDFVLNAPSEDEVPHPVLSVLRSSSREEAVGQLRDEITEIFSECFARRLDGPDAALRAELLSSWLLGITLMRKAIRTPALASVSDSTLLTYLRAGIDPLLSPPADPAEAAETDGR
ncbi:TetR/AcrR family transcriptional regulator [Streptomyces sp. NPDC005808]|uniref:TetR/AcrR family transcriptional regulator n=1 Tax=Streptomyces sp. NPDC005808 TaxID=3364734 RepID=UPI00369213DA